MVIRHAVAEGRLQQMAIPRLWYKPQINFMVRTLIRIMYGAALEHGSHAEAAAAYQRAVDLAPGRLVHRVELGRVLLQLRQPQQAYAQLQVSPFTTPPQRAIILCYSDVRPKLGGLLDLLKLHSSCGCCKFDIILQKAISASHPSSVC